MIVGRKESWSNIEENYDWKLPTVKKITQAIDPRNAANSHKDKYKRA